LFDDVRRRGATRRIRPSARVDGLQRHRHRQAYLQKLLKQALAALGFQEQARIGHYSYEMVR
jgi:hypothetical protein